MRCCDEPCSDQPDPNRCQCFPLIAFNCLCGYRSLTIEWAIWVDSKPLSALRSRTVEFFALITLNRSWQLRFTLIKSARSRVWLAARECTECELIPDRIER